LVEELLMNHAVIAAYRRSPFHFAKKGQLATVRPDDLAATVLAELIKTIDIDPTVIEDVVLGCAYPEASQGNNVARIVSLLAGLPLNLGGITMNRFCGSSMSAIHYAAGQIAMGAGEAFISGGIESMSMVPQGGMNFLPNPKFLKQENIPAEISHAAYIAMGETAENVARRYGISRSDQEAFALRSQQKAVAAQSSGKFSDEIVSIVTADAVIASDGCLRPNTTLEGLAGLKPAFHQDGTVTAGTASPLTDGAVMTLVCSENFAKQHGLAIMARIRATAVAGLEPEFMGMGPVPATRKVLKRGGVSIQDLDVIEINEAFASQAVACVQELDMDIDNVNIDGGAIALGHPLGATGARITAKAAQIMQRQGKQLALATQCIGGGQGIATLLEAV
jgi:acetyl-CoA acyltransferase